MPTFKPSPFSAPARPAAGAMTYGSYGAAEETSPAPAASTPGVAATLGAVIRTVSLAAAPVAMGVSYQRNRSVKWAFLHSFVAVPYLVYVGLDSRKK